MTSWLPSGSLARPAYLSLADHVARAVADGRLPAGEQLPTQRHMAHQLGVSVQTVSRAYEELARRGITSGEVGRGTFIRALRPEPDPPFIPERLGELIDLSILKPVCEAIHLEAMKAALMGLADSLPPSSTLSFRPNVVFPRHRALAVEWLKRCGLVTEARNVHLTNGATSAMTVALMAAAPPGTTVVTEEIGHHTLVPLAAYLGLKLRGLGIDSEGILPEALERACQEGEVRAVYLLPNAVGPTAATMGAKRRVALVAIARRHELLIIENDVLGPLLAERLPPFAALAPERTLYFTSFTKCVMPGLRTGYLVAPDRLTAAVANRHLVTSWIATPLIAEIATRWVEDGTALELVLWQRAALTRRQSVAAGILDGIRYASHPEGLHIWLPLPPARREDEFVSHARLHGVAIAPGASFVTSPSVRSPAVRISVGSTSEADMRAGLAIVANLIRSDPEPVLLAI